MREKVARTLNVFMNLNDSEKAELLEFLKEYPDYPFTTTNKIQKSLSETRGVFGVTFGPAPGSTCPYCGK